MSILGPLLQSLFQQIGPQIQQFLTSPAFPRLLADLSRVPPPLLKGTIDVAAQLPGQTADWYNALSPQDKERINGVLIWISQDLGGFIAAGATGLPEDWFTPAVEAGLAKVLPDPNAAPPPAEDIAFYMKYLQQRSLLDLPVSNDVKPPTLLKP
jgi:hypothetical protein